MRSRFVHQYSSKPGQAVQSHIDVCMVSSGPTEQMSVETFDYVKTIPDHLTWDPRLMCLKECFYFILEVWVGRGYVTLILFILFLSNALFFVNDRTSEVFSSFLAEFEVAKAATL